MMTRIELGLLYPLLKLRMEDLGRSMTGSTRLPDRKIAIQSSWGETCRRFLADVKRHPSRASDGYYLKTHLDYFDKMAFSPGEYFCRAEAEGSCHPGRSGLLL